MPGEMPNPHAPRQIGWSDIAHSCREYYELSGFNGGLRSVDVYGGDTRGYYLAAKVASAAWHSPA
jgi:hypothetical protein